MRYFNGRTKSLLVVFLVLVFFSVASTKPWTNFWIVLTCLTVLLFIVDLLFVSTDRIVFDPFYRFVAAKLRSNWETQMSSAKY